MSALEAFFALSAPSAALAWSPAPTPREVSRVADAARAAASQHVIARHPAPVAARPQPDFRADVARALELGAAYTCDHATLAVWGRRVG
jgi:hypothetical protein